MSEPKGPTAVVRCGSCGAERSADVAADQGEPITHCEWCGAEYPIPGEASAAAETPRGGRSGADRSA